MPAEDNIGNEGINEDESPAVPTDLLELHVELEQKGVTPEEFAHFTKGEA